MSTCALAGVDPVQFFTQDAPTITQTLYSQPGHEAFLAHDYFGNPLHIKIDEPLSLFSEIGGSLLAQGLELPAIPAYPMFIQRNHDGMHSVWYRAMVQPQSASRSSVRSVTKLTSTQVGEWLGQMVFNYVMGNSDVLTHSEGLAVSGQHVVTEELKHAFQSYGNASQDHLSAYLDQILYTHLRGMTEKEAAKAFDQFNRYLSRLEKLETSDVERLFGALFDSKAPSGIDYRAEFNRRIHEARAQAIQYFKAHAPEIAAAETLEHPVRADRPVFHFPAYERQLNSKLANQSGENGLWMHYFQDLSRRHRHSEKSMTFMFNQARKRKEIYYVGPTLSPEFFDTELDDPPQTHLNPKNPKTMIVVPTNDMEAEDIARIGKVSGAHVMELNGAVYIHGTKLTPALAEKVIHQAKKLGVDTVAVVEMAGDPLDVEKSFAEHGLRHLAIDHHSYAKFNRAKPFSSLEQISQLLGYDLGGVSKVIEVRDRSFIAGLKDLGLSKKAVEQLFPNSLYLKSAARSARFFSYEYGPFYIYSIFDGKMSDLVGHLSLKEWPKQPNVLILGQGIRFSGSPKFLEKLTNEFKEFESIVREQYLGGDVMRSQFFGMSGIPREYLDMLKAKALKQVESVLTPRDAGAFREDLERRLGIPKSLFEVTAPKLELRGTLSDRPVRIMPREELDKILSLPTFKRGNALAQVNWSELDETGKETLLKFAANARTRAEVEQFARIARYSSDLRWRPILDRLSIVWGKPKNRAEEKALNEVVRSLTVLSDSCIVRQVEERVKDLTPGDF